MDRGFWLDRWHRHDIGFHQPTVQEALTQYADALALHEGSRVFVPMCGKSLDMVWLADQGSTVVGVELSDLAVAEFFDERSRHPATATAGAFRVNRAGPYELWCGDYFAMLPQATRRITAVYDRAALVAMPRRLQARYAAKPAELTPGDVPVLLVALDFDPSQLEGPPFAIPASQVRSIFKTWFSVDCLEDREVIGVNPHLRDRGLKSLREAVYLLRRNAAVVDVSAMPLA
jgi:thiopurine S-methyltransferase